MHFQKSGKDLRVCWNTQDGSDIIFSTTTPLTVVDIMGNSRTIMPQNGQVQLTLSIYPIYVWGEIEKAAPTDNTIVYAVSNIDFTGTQGENGWYYGYWLCNSGRCE
jgi:hypothetical protein